MFGTLEQKRKEEEKETQEVVKEDWQQIGENLSVCLCCFLRRMKKHLNIIGIIWMVIIITELIWIPTFRVDFSWCLLGLWPQLKVARTLLFWMNLTLRPKAMRAVDFPMYPQMDRNKQQYNYSFTFQTPTMKASAQVWKLARFDFGNDLPSGKLAVCYWKWPIQNHWQLIYLWNMVLTCTYPLVNYHFAIDTCNLYWIFHDLPNMT